MPRGDDTALRRVEEAAAEPSVSSGDEDGPGPALNRKYQTETRFDAGQDVVFDTMIGAARGDAGLADGLQAGAGDASEDELDELDEDNDLFDGGDGGDGGGGGDDASASASSLKTSSSRAGAPRRADKTFLPLAGTVGNVQRVSARHMPEHYGAFYVWMVLTGAYPARWMSRRGFWTWCGFVLAIVGLRTAGSVTNQEPAERVYGVMVVTTSLISAATVLNLNMRRRLLLRAVRVHYVFEQAFYNRKLNRAEKERQRRVVSAWFRGASRKAVVYGAIVFFVIFSVFNVPRFIYVVDPQGTRSPAERGGGEHAPSLVDEALLEPWLGYRGTQVFLMITDFWFFGLPMVCVCAFSLVYHTVSHQRSLIAGHQVTGTADGVPVDTPDDEAGAAAASGDLASVSRDRGHSSSTSVQQPRPASLSLGPDSARGAPPSPQLGPRGGGPRGRGGGGDPSWRSRMSFAYRLTYSLHQRATAALKPGYVSVWCLNTGSLLVYGYMLLTTEGKSPDKTLILTPLMCVTGLAFVAEYVHKLHRQSVRASEFLSGEFGASRSGSGGGVGRDGKRRRSLLMSRMLTDVGRTTMRGRAAFSGEAERARQKVLDDVMDGRRGFEERKDTDSGSDDDGGGGGGGGGDTAWRTSARQDNATHSSERPVGASFRFTLSDLESLSAMKRSDLPSVGLARGSVIAAGGSAAALETGGAAGRPRKGSEQEVDRASYVSSGVSTSAVVSVLAVVVQNATALALVAVGLTTMRFSLQFPPCLELNTDGGNFISENTDNCSDATLLAKDVESAFFAQPVLWGITLWVAVITFRVRPFFARFFDILIVFLLVTVAGSAGIFNLYRSIGHDGRAAVLSSAILIALTMYNGASVWRTLHTRRIFFLVVYVIVCFVAFLAVKYVSVRFVSAKDDDERFAYVVVAVPLLRTVVMGVALQLVKAILPLAEHPVAPITRQYALLALPLAVFGIVARLFIFSLEGVGGILSSIALVSVQEVFVRLTVTSRTGAGVFILSRGSLPRAVEAMARVRGQAFLPDRIYVGMLVEHYCLTAALGITVIGRLLYDIELKMGSLLAVWLLQLVAELVADFASVVFEEGMMDIFEVRYWKAMTVSPANYLLPCSYMLWAVQCFMGLEMSAIVRLS